MKECNYLQSGCDNLIDDDAICCKECLKAVCYENVPQEIKNDITEEYNEHN